MPELRPGWCHCMSHTYGTWLPGDPRGFRTRHHREHVEGDYKNPPAEDYRDRHRAARDDLKGDAVVLSVAARQAALLQVVASLQRYGVELLGASVSATHMHLLGRFPEGPTPGESGLRGQRTSAVEDPVRHLVGKAKQWSAKQLAKQELVAGGRVWGRRGKIVRITDRAHQVRTVGYILKHAEEGAAVWSFRDGPVEE